ncbi:hypothetical protein ACHAXN_010229 [Cyclotella atomus]
MPTQHEDDISSAVDSESSSSSSDDESIPGELSPSNEIQLLHSIATQQRLLSNFLPDESTELAQSIQACEEKVTSYLLAKLIEGKVGADLITTLQQCQEKGVNSHLLVDLRKRYQSQLDETKSANNSQSTPTIITNGNDHSSIQESLSLEIRYTIPGLISLLTHCSLYLTIYACLNKFLEYICDRGIIYFLGWHISKNAFDCTHHEQFFHVICLIVGCCLSRWTGSIWAWVDNEEYQRRLKAERRKRKKSRWIQWLEGRGPYKSKWGPRWKLGIDSLSFFIVYISVDKFMRDFAGYALDTRAAVLEGMPSRQRQQQVRLNTELAEEGQCVNLDGVNDKLAEECTNSFVVQEEFISDIMNWIENKNRCRWVEKEANEEDNEEEGAKVRLWKQHDEEWKQLINEQDEKYLIENVSYKTYYELVGDPGSQFIDPHNENIFFIVLTLAGFGVLLCLGAPFLLI